MFKTNDDRLEQVLEFVGEFFPNVENLVEKRIASLGSQRDAVASALSLGKRSWGESADETKRRNGVRTLLFLLFTEGNCPVELAEEYKAQYQSMDLDQLIRNIRGRLPVVEFSPKRELWDFGKFTAVPQTPQLQDAPPKFCYLVFGMMNTEPIGGVSYQTILGNPNIVRRFLLSTSIIDENHRSTYFPYGLILQVPKQNIISTNTKDQGFKNYRTAVPGDTRPPHVLSDSMDDIRTVTAKFDFRTPDEILVGTKPLGDLGYNEIVVMGTSPTGGPISVQGFFMKVSSTKERFVRFRGGSGSSPEKDPFVTNSIYQMMLASRLPIVQIVDTSGGGK
jgi:hypothetical protein